jgi:hypothetical protein
MLEYPWMLRYSLCDKDAVREPNLSEAHGSDKSSAADNQQERLIKIGWIVGSMTVKDAFRSTSCDSLSQQLAEMIRILRDYMPNADMFVGEDIVRSAWRHAG